MKLFEIDISIMIIRIKLMFKEGIHFLKKKDMFYIEEENIRLEAASLANDIIEINKCVEPTKMVHKYKVENEELICDLYYEGLIKKNNTGEMLFSFTSCRQIDYEEMECYAIEYIDQQEIKSRPRLLGTDGQTKKIAVRFTEVKHKNAPFKVKVHINLGKCIVSKRDYIISQLKYAKANLVEYKVQIEFGDTIPSNVRVYELELGKMQFKKTLYSNGCFFIDKIEKSDSISLRAYIFDREENKDEKNK